MGGEALADAHMDTEAIGATSDGNGTYQFRAHSCRVLINGGTFIGKPMSSLSSIGPVVWMIFPESIATY